MGLLKNIGASFFLLCLLSYCSADNVIRPRNARDFYEQGLTFVTQREYPQAQKSFKRCLELADPVTEEYYMSMCYFEVAFTHQLAGNETEALKYIEILLSQVISSKEPRLLAEQLRKKILAEKGYQNASY